MRNGWDLEAELMVGDSRSSEIEYCKTSRFNFADSSGKEVRKGIEVEKLERMDEFHQRIKRIAKVFLDCKSWLPEGIAYESRN